MKSKIVSLSKNSEFLSLLNGNKIANKYSTIFFKKLKNKNYKCLNLIFVAKKKIGNAVIRNKIKSSKIDPNNPNTWGKVGRNETCPCGSGKKFKNCHGKN